MKIIEYILRSVFTWIDSIVAWLITTLYNLFYDLSNIMLYSEDVIKSIGQRIGLILGIFMLFRLAITLITYLISPDKMSDNAKGGGKILINIIVSLVLLATVNIIFVQAYKIQKTVISSNVIAKIFFGTKAQTPTVDVGYHLYTGLFSPNTNVLGNECDSLWDTTFQLVGSPCYDKLNSVLDDNARKEIVNARNNQNVSKIFVNYDLVMAKSNGEFVFNYYPIVSTLAGVVAALMLLSFSMDLATRAIKLLFLQLIAPIPIISNMDPGKGQDIFKKWYKECFSTYISLFVRLLVINFAVYMITLITVNFKDIIGCNVFVNILLIIGCLMFAKQVPKLIEEMFGIKMDGGMTLNPLKKFQEQALFGKNITGLAAGATVGTLGALTGAGWAQGFKGAFGGLVSGKGFGETWKNQVSKNINMRGYLAEGSTFWGRRAAQISSSLGIPTPSENYEADVHRIDEEIKEIDNQMKPLNDSISDRKSYTDKVKSMEDRAIDKIKKGEAGKISQQYLAMVNRTEKLREDLRNGRNGVTEQMVAEAEMNANRYLTNEGMNDYIDYTTGYSTGISTVDIETGTISGTISGRTLTGSDVINSDAAMESMYSDIENMTSTPAQYTFIDSNGTSQTVVIDDANAMNGSARRHKNAGMVTGSVSYDNRTSISEANARKQTLQQQKAELYERQRTAKANQSAVSGK